MLSCGRPRSHAPPEESQEFQQAGGDAWDQLCHPPLTKQGVDDALPVFWHPDAMFQTCIPETHRYVES